MFLNCGVEETLESPLDCKDIQPVNLKRKSVMNIHCKDWCWSWSSNTLATWCEELTHWKRPWCWERLKVGGEGDAEDKIVGWHHQLDGYEFEQAPSIGDGQGGLACCSPWGHKESDTTERLNRIDTNLNSCLIKVLIDYFRNYLDISWILLNLACLIFSFTKNILQNIFKQKYKI